MGQIVGEMGVVETGTNRPNMVQNQMGSDDINKTENGS